MSTPASRAKAALTPNRPLKMISIRLHENIIDNLKEVAGIRDMSYQVLARLYISEGLHRDFNQIENHRASDALFNVLFEEGRSLEEIRRIQEKIYPVTRHGLKPE